MIERVEPETLAVNAVHVFPFESERFTVPPESIEIPTTRSVAPVVFIAAVVTLESVPTPDCDATCAIAIFNLC